MSRLLSKIPMFVFTKISAIFNTILFIISKQTIKKKSFKNIDLIKRYSRNRQIDEYFCGTFQRDAPTRTLNCSAPIGTATTRVAVKVWLKVYFESQ